MSKLVRAALFVVLIAGMVLGNFAFSTVAKAQGGIAISGSFYRHHFQMLRGESLMTPDIYVTVFNHEENPIKAMLTHETPPGVELLLAQVNFLIPPKGEQKVEVGIRVSPEAVPGDYILTITAEVQREGQGIVITGGAQQRAKLTIFGEAGEVRITTVSLEGEPFRAEVHLYQKIEGQLSPCGFSNTGKIEKTRLVPGEYMVQVFFEETEVAKEEFSLAAKETKDIVLVAKTILIHGFAVVAHYNTEGKIVFAKMVYAVENIYQPLKNVKAILKVDLNKKFLETAEIVSLPSLDVGSMEGSYQYAPSQWQSGIYAFKLELYSQDKLCVQSPEEELKVEIPGLVVNRLLIVGAIVIVLLVIVVVLMLRRRKVRR